MSSNKSKLQLNQLVYRHLKENGFHSAAEELQRHNPQVESDVSMSLLDVYKSWLKVSKKKKRQKSAKRSSPREQEQTSIKGQVTSPSKKAGKPVKSPTLSEKSVSQKKKKGAETVIKAKKLKLDAKDKAASAGGGDSDSDSSLDVEKWKKLVFQMTESDLAKMEVISALDPSAPQPKKKRVRKPRAKPLPISAASVQENNRVAEKNSKDKEETVEQTTVPLNTRLKKSRPEDTAHVSSSESPDQKKNRNKSKDRPAASTVPPKKLTPSKENIIPLTPSQPTTDEPASEPKKKKKKKEIEPHKDIVAKDAAETVGNVFKEHKTSENKKQKAVKKTKGAKTESEEDKAETMGNCVEDISESAVQEKKEKKKKKKKAIEPHEDIVAKDAAETVGNVFKENKTSENKKQKAVKKTKGAKTESEEDKAETMGNCVEDISESAVQEKKEKKKKKKKEIEPHEDIVAKDAAETVGNVFKENKTSENKKQKAVKKTKGAKTESEEDKAETMGNCVEDISESAVQKKKKKKEKRKSSAETAEETTLKKKKLMVDGEKNSELISAEEINAEQTLTEINKVGIGERIKEKVKQKKVKGKKETVICEENLEMGTVKEQENTEQAIEDEENPELIVKKKKAKKKKKEPADGEENPEVVVEEIEGKKNPEDISEQINEEKSKKKHKAHHKEAKSPHPDKDFKSTSERAICDKEEEDLEHLSVHSHLLEVSNQETSSPSKKKKKKRKLKPDEVPEEAGVSPEDVTATQTTPADSHRKKKKPSPES